MATTEVIDKLQALQEVLAEKYQLEKQKKEAPDELKVQEGLLSRQRKQYLEKNSLYEECKKRVGDLEFELRQAEKLREDGEKGMDNVSTHREYEALDKQITEATNKEAEIRKELDKEKKYLNDLNEQLKIEESMIKVQEDDLNSRKSTIDKQISKLTTQVEKLEKTEEDISKDLNPEIVYKFQRIIQRNSDGIVGVKNGVCEGCYMILPAQFANEVRDGEEILFCPYCSRVLFYKESDANEDAFYAIGEAGSLTGFDDEFADESDGEGLGFLADDEVDSSDEYNSDDDDDENEDSEESDEEKEDSDESDEE